MILAVVWWVLAALVAYTYAGYPALLAILARIRPNPPLRADIQPSVSLIIAAHNEEACIREKLENSLALDYPRDKLEILVASDASTDRTNDIVAEFAGQGVRLNTVPERRGKSYAQNHTVEMATGDVLVFSDANSMYEPDAVAKLVRNLADPNVGYVSGELRYRRPRSAIGAGEGLYWRYETWIKRKESETGNIINGNGAIYAVPRRYFVPVPDHTGADLWLPLTQIRRGLRTVHEPEAVAYEETSLTAADEYSRKHRSIVRVFHVLTEHAGMLNPFRYGLTSVKLLSHRYLRYVVPYFILALLVLNAFMLSSAFFRATMGLQLAFYAAALVGAWLQKQRKRVLVFYVPYYFCVVNLAAVQGALRFLRGERVRVWEKAATTRIHTDEEDS
ncbi:MAG: glycosyltransferase family 2 protein [Anaerolineae bacterium]|nr:glycosyltransferase family 2 protein [Anaerolineae bacterium]